MKIFIVMQSTGEYSAREEFAVCAFLDEEKAKQKVNILDEDNRKKIDKYQKIPEAQRKIGDYIEESHYFLNETELYQ